jgi:hypothetical protein
MKTIGISVIALGASVALGGYTVTHEDSFNAFGATMPYGSGNSNTNFTIARNGNVEIGLKAKERFVGDLTTDGNGRYFAQAGSVLNDGVSTWNLDYGFSLPQAALPSNYSFNLMVDFDAGFGTQSWVTLDIDQTLENFFQNVNTGGDSQNLGFNFWGNSTSGVLQLELDASGYIAFDPFATGEYDIVLEVLDNTGGLVARSSIIVEVVPTPGTLAMLGFGSLIATRRKR